MYLPTRLPETETRATDDPVAQTLLRAAQVIRERGWCQNVLRDRRGSVCMLGALDAAWPQYGQRDPEGVLNAIQSTLQLTNYRSVPAWNDTPGRTAAEVISALESAALSRATAIRGV